MASVCATLQTLSVRDTEPESSHFEKKTTCGEESVRKDECRIVDDTGNLVPELNEVYLKDVRAREFGHLGRGIALLNNGSYGCCPKSVLEAQAQLVLQWLKYPCSFYYGPLQEGFLASRGAVASMINCPVQEVVLVDNATTASTIVAKDFAWSVMEGKYQKGDSILVLDCLCRAMKAAFQSYGAKAGAHIIVANIPFPVSSNSEIISSFELALEVARKEHLVIRLAVIDHIVSMPSIILPVKDMVAMCRKYGVGQVFVDGTQAPGNVGINVEEIDADYYTGSLDNWVFGPSSAAFLHCKSRHLSRLHHPIISHNHGHGLAAECEWVGTRNYSAQLVIPVAFKFMKDVAGGLESIGIYNHNRAVAMGKMLAEEWGTHCGAPPSLSASMVMVAVPPALNITSTKDGLDLRSQLRKDFLIEVAVFVTSSKPVTGYLRISHQIYNTYDDFLRLRDAVIVLVSRTGVFPKRTITDQNDPGVLP